MIGMLAFANLTPAAPGAAGRAHFIACCMANGCSRQSGSPAARACVRADCGLFPRHHVEVVADA